MCGRYRAKYSSDTDFLREKKISCWTLGPPSHQWFQCKALVRGGGGSTPADF